MEEALVEIKALQRRAQSFYETTKRIVEIVNVENPDIHSVVQLAEALGCAHALGFCFGNKEFNLLYKQASEKLYEAIEKFCERR